MMDLLGYQKFNIDKDPIDIFFQIIFTFYILKLRYTSKKCLQAFKMNENIRGESVYII